VVAGAISAEPLIDQRANVLLGEVRAAYQLQAARRSVRTVELALTAAEREAAGQVTLTPRQGR
jgi:hypothetical protein